MTIPLVNLCVLSPWAGDGRTPATAYRPAVAAAPLASWADVTGTPGAQVPPTPNLCVIEATADPAAAAALLADPAAAAAVLWCDGADRPPDGVPADAGYAATVEAAAAAIGPPWTADTIRLVIGVAVAGRTRREIAGTVAAWLRLRPKGVA